MTRRCPLSGTLSFAVLSFVLGALPASTRADAINPNATTATATYRLSTDSTLPVPEANIAGPQVVALILPAGSVVPPKLADGTEGSPLTVLPDSTGFDANHLVVALKDGKTASGDPEQMFGLVFFGKGLSSGGVLHFALSIDKALANNPPLLQPQTAGIKITLDPPATTRPPVTGASGSGVGSGGETVPPVQVPEPFSLVAWATLVGVVARRHSLRHCRNR